METGKSTEKRSDRTLKIVADLHTHTIASGHAYATITEMAKAAAEKGLQMLGITDHGPTMPGSPHRYYFGNLRVLPQALFGVEIIKGVEANILNTRGELDLPENYLADLDIVLAGLHSVCYTGSDREGNTKAVLAAMNNPYVDCIVHLGNPEYPADYEAVVKKAVEKRVLLEINNTSLRGGTRRGSEGNCREIARLAKKWGALFLISSDAHFSADVASFKKSLEMLSQEGIREGQILNTSREKVQRFLANKGRKRFLQK